MAEQIKCLHNAIDLATSDMQHGPNAELYSQVETWITVRADMPKHCLAQLSKRLMIKNDKVTYLTIDLLEYLMYVNELPFWTQLCTKEFLLKISQILQSKDQSSQVAQKILQFIKSEYELFKPHQDLLPTFFQFYEGLIKKGYDKKADYVSPYRPAELKKYPTKIQNKPKPATFAPTSQIPQQKRPTNNQTQKFSVSGTRQRIVLTNQIIDECNPQEQVKNNNLLIEMMTGLKQIEKSINSTIAEGCDQKMMQEVIALNDDLLITFRRFKDLQRNKKPEPFIKTELVSNYMVKQQPKFQKKQERSIFDQFDLNQSQTKPKKAEQKKQMNIFQFQQQEKKDANTSKKGGLNIFEVDEDSSSKPIQNMHSNSHPIQMNSISSIQMNMGTMSVPMQNVANFNSGLLGLNLGQQQPVQPQSQSQMPSTLLGLNKVESPTKTGFNFGNITAPSNLNLGGITMNSNSGFNYNSQFATEAVKVGNYTQNDLTDLTDLFSKKL